MKSGSSHVPELGPVEVTGRDGISRRSDRSEFPGNGAGTLPRRQENYVKKIIAAAFMFLFAGIAQAGQPSAQGKWSFTFTGGTTIANADVNIVQDAHGNLNSPFFAGYVAGSWYQNYEAFSDSTCSSSGWAPVQPTGSNVNGNFNFKLQVDTGIFYDLKGSVSDNGTTMSGSYTSNCSSDHGSFTGSLYAPVNITYTGTINGSNDDGTVTQYDATLVLAEDGQFNVTGSITLNTTSGAATCYGTINLAGPATGDFIELGGGNTKVQLLRVLVFADHKDFSSVSVQTLQIASLSCGNDPAQGTLSSKKSNKRSSPRR